MALAKFEQDVTRLFGSMGVKDVDEFLSILADAVEMAKSGTGTTEERLCSLAKLVMEQAPSYELEAMKEEALQASRRRREIAAFNSGQRNVIPAPKKTEAVAAPTPAPKVKAKPAARPRHAVAEKVVLESEMGADPFSRQDEEFLATAAEA